jgi:hypothetical protein
MLSQKKNVAIIAQLGSRMITIFPQKKKKKKKHFRNHVPVRKLDICTFRIDENLNTSI